jgi:hypothetical protein
MPAHAYRRAACTAAPLLAIALCTSVFNTDAAEHVLVIRARDGKPLDAAEGPLALRALADTRPGPRHVRNLCAIVARTS